MIENNQDKERLEKLLDTIGGSTGVAKSEVNYSGSLGGILSSIAAKIDASGTIHKIRVDYKPTLFILAHIHAAQKAIEKVNGYLLEIEHWNPIDNMGEWADDLDTTITYYVML